MKILVNYALDDPAFADLEGLQRKLQDLRLVLAGARVEQMIFRNRKILHLDYRIAAERLMEYRYICSEGVDVLGRQESITCPNCRCCVLCISRCKMWPIHVCRCVGEAAGALTCA